MFSSGSSSSWRWRAWSVVLLGFRFGGGLRRGRQRSSLRPAAKNGDDKMRIAHITTTTIIATNTMAILVATYTRHASVPSFPLPPPAAKTKIITTTIIRRLVPLHHYLQHLSPQPTGSDTTSDSSSIIVIIIVVVLIIITMLSIIRVPAATVSAIIAVTTAILARSSSPSLRL